MKVQVDFDKCDSNGLCEALAPEVFWLDDDDYLFRNAPREDNQGAVLAHYLTLPRQSAPTALAQRIAVLQLDTLYGEELAQAFHDGVGSASA